LPEGATVIESPGDYPHLFIRVQVKTLEDRSNSMDIQRKIKLTGVSKHLDFDNAIQFTIDTHDVYPQNEDLLASVIDYTEPDAQSNITITFSAEDPKDGTYWMPVNAGEPYYFVARYNGPDLDNPPPSPCD